MTKWVDLKSVRSAIHFFLCLVLMVVVKISFDALNVLGLKETEKKDLFYKNKNK